MLFGMFDAVQNVFYLCLFPPPKRYSLAPSGTRGHFLPVPHTSILDCNGHSRASRPDSSIQEPTTAATGSVLAPHCAYTNEAAMQGAR